MIGPQVSLASRSWIMWRPPSTMSPSNSVVRLKGHSEPFRAWDGGRLLRRQLDRQTDRSFKLSKGSKIDSGRSSCEQKISLFPSASPASRIGGGGATCPFRSEVAVFLRRPLPLVGGGGGPPPPPLLFANLLYLLPPGRRRSTATNWEQFHFRKRPNSKTKEQEMRPSAAGERATTAR